MCIKTIHVLNAADPSLLSTAKATILLPFLKSASTVRSSALTTSRELLAYWPQPSQPQDQLISDYLLKIFRSAVMAMPKSTSKFSRDLQAALVPMLNKPGSSTGVSRHSPCVFRSASTDSSPVDSARGRRVLLRRRSWPNTRFPGNDQRLPSWYWWGLIPRSRPCSIADCPRSTVRLGGEVKKLLNPATAASVNMRTLPILCYLSALLCEHGDFDQVRATQPGTPDAFPVSAASR